MKLPVGLHRRLWIGLASCVALTASRAWADEPTSAPEATRGLPSAKPAPPAPPRLDVDIVTQAGPSRPVAPPGPRRDSKKSPSMGARLEWRWPEFQPYQYGLSIGQGLLAIGSQAIPGGARALNTRNSVDEAARDALRVTSPEGSLAARDASDVGLVLLLNQQLIDTLFVTWWYNDKGSTAWQMTLIDLQTISFSAGIQSLVAGAVGRERPYGRSRCSTQGELASTDCTGSNRFRSFFSGHSSTAFTIAALTCVHHINLPLYGGGFADAVPCGIGMLGATTVALLRVAGDEHHLTDVLTGAAFGTASGFALPYLFHYAWSAPTKDADPGKPTIALAPAAGGLSVYGSF